MIDGTNHLAETLMRFQPSSSSAIPYFLVPRDPDCAEPRIKVFLEIFAPGNDVSSCNGALSGRTQPSEGQKVSDIDLICPTGFEILDVGEPFVLGRQVRQRAKLRRRQRPCDDRRRGANPKLGP
jgi:hypothetical protein